MGSSLQKHLFIPVACLKRHSEQNLEVKNFIKLFKLASHIVSFPMVLPHMYVTVLCSNPITSSVLLALLYAFLTCGDG